MIWLFESYFERFTHLSIVLILLLHDVIQHYYGANWKKTTKEENWKFDHLTLTKSSCLTTRIILLKRPPCVPTCQAASSNEKSPWWASDPLVSQHRQTVTTRLPATQLNSRGPIVICIDWQGSQTFTYRTFTNQTFFKRLLPTTLLPIKTFTYHWSLL